jgi:hypothetical protein
MHMRLLLLASIAALGCTSSVTMNDSQRPPEGTLGKEGKIGFAYGNPKPSCELGCAIMQGSEEPIDLDPMPDDNVLLESSDPAILTVGPGTRFIAGDKPPKLSELRVKAIAPGTVEVRIKKASGELLERVDLTVAIPARIALEGATTVKIGETIFVRASAFDAAGTRLEAYTGWDFKGEAPTVARVSTPCSPFDHCLYDSADVLSIEGLTAGTAVAKASGAGVTGTHSVSVTP